MVVAFFGSCSVMFGLVWFRLAQLRDGLVVRGGGFFNSMNLLN